MYVGTVGPSTYIHTSCVLNDLCVLWIRLVFLYQFALIPNDAVSKKQSSNVFVYTLHDNP